MTNNIIAATSIIPQVVVAQFITNAEVTQYTAPASSTFKVANATLTNVAASPTVVSVSVVKTGGAAGTSNRVLHAYNMAAGDSLVLNELADHVLGTGDFISAIAGATSAVAFVLSGYVNS